MPDTDIPSNAVSVRVRHVPRARVGGDRRHAMRIGPQPAYVDASRAGENSVLVPYAPDAEMAARARERHAQAGGVRGWASNNAVATVGVISFGKGAQETMSGLSRREQDLAIERAASTLAARYGVELRGLVVHRDETALHAHFSMDCRREDGRPMSKLMRGSALQDIVAEALDVPGIERGVRKADRKAAGEPAHRWLHRSVRQLHEDLPREIEEARRAAESARERVAEMQGRVAKLEAREALSEKESKRLATYARRLDEREAELQRQADRLGQLEAMQAPDDPFADQSFGG